MSIPQLKDGEQVVYFKAGGEWCYLWTPTDYKRNGSTPVVIHHHGARGYIREGESDWLDTESKIAFLKAVREGGKCVIAGSHACGDHWGNSCAVDANAALLRALDECKGIDTSRLGFMGGGLGGTLIWNSILGPFAGRVKIVAVLQAVANLEAVIKEKKFKDVCLKAYGLDPNTSDDLAYSKIVTSDPMPRLKKLKKGVKLPYTAIYHGARDSNIPADTNAIPLSEALKKAGGEVELNVFTEVEHNVYAMGKTMEDRLRVLFSKL